MSKYISGALALFMAFFTATTMATEYAAIAPVKRTVITSDGTFGGCMVQLDHGLGGCGDGWVTFDCIGTYTTKDNAYRMFDMALMAYALNKELSVWVTDTKTHNGVCFANRVDIKETVP